MELFRVLQTIVYSASRCNSVYQVIKRSKFTRSLNVRSLPTVEGV